MQERASSARPAKPLSNQLISQSANQRGALAPLACASTPLSCSQSVSPKVFRAKRETSAFPILAVPMEAWKPSSFFVASVVLWHVVDVPGVQGELLPAGVWGGAPHRKPSFQASKLLSFQAVRPAGGSRPLIGSNLRNLRFPILEILKRRGRTNRTYRTTRTKAAEPPCTSLYPSPRRGVLFSVLRSLGRVAPLPFSVFCSLFS